MSDKFDKALRALERLAYSIKGLQGKRKLGDIATDYEIIKQVIEERKRVEGLLEENKLRRILEHYHAAAGGFLILKAREADMTPDEYEAEALKQAIGEIRGDG